MMSTPISQQEKDLWAALRNGETVGEAYERLGIPPRRALYFCHKWANQKIYDWGTSAFYGWIEDWFMNDRIYAYRTHSPKAYMDRLDCPHDLNLDKWTRPIYGP